MVDNLTVLLITPETGCDGRQDGVIALGISAAPTLSSVEGHAGLEHCIYQVDPIIRTAVRLK